MAAASSSAGPLAGGAAASSSAGPPAVLPPSTTVVAGLPERPPSWYDAWTVTPDPATNFLDPNFNGASRHPAASTTPTILDAGGADFAALLRDFCVGVILGPSGSGKTQILRDLRGQTGFNESLFDGLQFLDNQAVISHGGLDNDLLGSVGFNKIPAWMRPYKVLSNGEQVGRG